MAKLAHFIIEVRYAPLPASEAEDKRQRLRALVLHGALRYIERHAAQLREIDSETEGFRLETIRK